MVKFEVFLDVLPTKAQKVGRFATSRGAAAPETLLQKRVLRGTGDFTTAVSSQWLQRLPRRAYPQTFLTWALLQACGNTRSWTRARP